MAGSVGACIVGTARGRDKTAVRLFARGGKSGRERESGVGWLVGWFGGWMGVEGNGVEVVGWSLRLLETEVRRSGRC